MLDMDWLDDDAMSPEETMRRFEALNPEPTVGPSRNETVHEWALRNAFSLSNIRVVEPGIDVRNDGDVVAR